MLGWPELTIIIILMLLLGGPSLIRKLERLVSGTRKAVHRSDLPQIVDETQREIKAIGAELLDTQREIKSTGAEMQKAVKDALLGSADPLRVFICSMQDELAAERTSVAERLQELGKELGLTRPLRFEMLPASPDTPDEVYRRAVERCDVFVMIVAEDVSAPVLREYQLALKNKKPCFCFVKSVEERSDAAQRFLADIASTWVEFQTPEELVTEVVFALVADLVENYRQRRLGYADMVALLALGSQLEIDPQLLEQTKEQIEQEHVFRKQPWEPETIYIPAGWFWMGSQKHEGHSSERPQHRLFLKSYWIGKYPVTNAQYKHFVDAEECKLPNLWTSDGEIPAGKENHPAVSTWDDAIAYCQWLTRVTGQPYQLPSEAEWEKAARGMDRRTYPWGNKFDETKCNVHKSVHRDTTPVGKYSPQGDSPYGCADMAGNVWEWTRSLYNKYPYDSEDGRENPESSGIRVLRGGSFYGYGSLTHVRCAYRDKWPPPNADWHRGFRVVAALFSPAPVLIEINKLPAGRKFVQPHVTFKPKDKGESSLI